MAVKYYVDEKNRKTIAVLEGCRWDAINRIRKLTNGEMYVGVWSLSRKDIAIMPDVFRAVVTCSEHDEYNVEEGKAQAKQKLMRNYHRAMDKRIAKFKEYLLQTADMLKV